MSRLNVILFKCFRGYVFGLRCRFCIWPSWCHCHSLSLAPVLQQIQIGFTFLVPAHPCSPGQNPRGS